MAGGTSDKFTFCFKGGRSYVHGTDLYNAICTYLANHYSGDIDHLDLWIRKIATNNMMGGVFDLDEAPAEPPAVTCRFESGGQTRKLYLFEDADPVDCRYAYDEESIVRKTKCQLDSKEITLYQHLPFTLVELIVAMNKALVQALFEPTQGKWYFARLKLERLFPKEYESGIRLSFDASFGLHLTRSKIFVDDVAYGDIFFSLVEG